MLSLTYDDEADFLPQRNPDGTVLEMVVWQIPADHARPHGFKYRLHFGTQSGRCIVRYDNEKSKGDHRHLGNREEPYEFISLEQLLKDFRHDLEKRGGQKQ